MTTPATRNVQESTTGDTLFVAFELSEKTWKLSFTTGHGQKPRERTVTGRCRKGVDSVLDCYPKLVAIDEQPDHQVVHGRRFGKANRATHETFDPCPQIDVFALDFLRMLFADLVLLGVDMPRVGTPSIRVKPGDAKGFQQRLGGVSNVDIDGGNTL